MGLMTADVQKQVKEIFNELDQPVKLVMFTQAFECQMCKETRELIQEVAALSGKITVEVFDFVKDAEIAEMYKIDKTPAVAVVRGGKQPKDFGIRLYGIPSGYEFSSLIEDILLVSRGLPELSDKTLKELEKLDKPVRIQVFVTPTCPYCPRAVVLAHKLAMASDKITADMVEASEFPQLANKYQVYGVPRTVINDVIHIEGAVPEGSLLPELMKVLDDSRMAKLRKQWEAELQ